MSRLICQYCSQHNSSAETRCTHCGGPLRTAEHLVADGGSGASEIAPIAGLAIGATRFGGVAATIASKLSQWLWRAVGTAVSVLALAWVLLTHSCSVPDLPTSTVDVVQSLPDPVREAASCQRSDMAARVVRCTIRAGHPMLLGGITGGRDLNLTARVVAAGEMSAVLDEWRHGGEPVLDAGPTFVAIGPSVTVRFANRVAGVTVETGAFVDRAAAQTFLARASVRRIQ